jgi:hypothetical protein
MEETLSLYSDEERGRLLSAMMAYSFRGEEPELTGNERFVWPMLRNHIDSCEERSEKMKANGKRSGKTESKHEANESKEKQTEAKLQQTEANGSKAVANPSKTEPIQEQEQDHEQEHVHDQDHKRTKGKRTRFVPPTPEEVQAYMLEHEGTHIQAAKFHAYYSSNGWKVGKGPMSDWKAAARGWILRDKDSGFSGGNRSSPPQKDQMMRYTQEERRKTYSAAVVDFDE